MKGDHLGIEPLVRGSAQDLATPSLHIARLEYPALDAARYLEQLRTMAADVRARLASQAHVEGPEGWGREIEILNDYLFKDLGFHGGDITYEDTRNNLLNAVIDRRTGIPIMLSIVYIEVARRAGVPMEGISFPGHFLVRRPADPPARASRGVIVDPFNSGAILSVADCRQLLRSKFGEDAPFAAPMLKAASRAQIVTRMLTNLKHLYVRMHSFPQALVVCDWLLALNPRSLPDKRDRGLLAYQLNRFPAALRDLEDYLGRLPADEGSDDERSEREQLREHVASLRRRVAELN